MNTSTLSLTEPVVKEQRIILSGVTWPQYETLQTTLEEVSGVKLTYLEGYLELMSPSPEHENPKATFGELLSTYLRDKNIRFYRCGSPTIKNQSVQRGKEPDESYNIGSKKDIPDIAIEIIVSSGGLDILSIYQGLGVPEVWFWQNSQLSVYHLREQGYEQVKCSEFLPDLDLDVLAKYINYSDQYDAVIQFREWIQKPNKNNQKNS